MSISCGRIQPARVVVATVLRGGGSTGVETHIREVVEYLGKFGTPTELVTSFSGGGHVASVVCAPRALIRKVLPAASVVWYRWSHALCLAGALRRRLRRLADEPGTVVYAQCPVSAYVALRARRSPQQKVVLAVHFNVSQADEWADRGMIPRQGRTFNAIRRLEQRVLTSVDGLVFVSQATLADVGAHVTGLDQTPIAVIPNFRCDTSQERDPRLDPPADLVTVGSLEYRKNHAFLLDVLAEATKLGSRYSLDVVGDGEDREALTRRAQALGLSDRVRFLGYQSDPRSLLPGHRMYVHAARHEACPIAVIEAMAAGLPVLAGPVGGIPELLDHGHAGHFWPLDDPTDAARILVGLLGDTESLVLSGQAARRRFVDTYRPEQVVPMLARFLSSPSVAERRAASYADDTPVAL